MIILSNYQCMCFYIIIIISFLLSFLSSLLVLLLLPLSLPRSLSLPLSLSLWNVIICNIGSIAFLVFPLLFSFTKLKFKIIPGGSQKTKRIKTCFSCRKLGFTHIAPPMKLLACTVRVALNRTGPREWLCHRHWKLGEGKRQNNLKDTDETQPFTTKNISYTQVNLYILHTVHKCKQNARNLVLFLMPTSCWLVVTLLVCFAPFLQIPGVGQRFRGFLHPTWRCQSKGNPLTHLILW